MRDSCHVFFLFLSLFCDCISRGLRLCRSLWAMDEDIIGDGCVSGRQKWMRVKNGRSCYFFSFV